MEKRGIKDFLEYKNQVEKERPILAAEERLITIDGVDGSGKSLISKLLHQQLQEIFGDDQVVLCEITNLRGSAGQDRLKKQLEQQTSPAAREDITYVAGVNRAYGEIVAPSIKSGKIVIVDRSEVDLLRHAIESGDKPMIEKRKKLIENGTVTHSYWAGNRIFVEAPADNILTNLQNRGNNSKYDPTNLEEVKARIRAQKQAEEITGNLPHEGEINVIHVSNNDAVQPNNLEDHLNSVVLEIINKLKIKKAHQ